jgi:hypothetical protein
MTLSIECSTVLEIMTELSLGAGGMILSSGAINTQCPTKCLPDAIDLFRSTLAMASAGEQTHEPTQHGRALCRNPQLISGTSSINPHRLSLVTRLRSIRLLFTPTAAGAATARRDAGLNRTLIHWTKQNPRGYA